MKLVFLGTGGSWPSKRRNVSSIAVRMNGEIILLDCGEGTQRQLFHASVSFMKIRKILITHFHGDHFLGLAGLIQSMYLNEREEPLDIYGPVDTTRFVSGILSLGYFHPSFQIRLHDMEDGQEIECEGYTITTAAMDHGAPTLAYRIREDERTGRFDKPKALELGIPEGPLFGRLQRGETVEVKGRTFTPDMVLGPKRPGRTLVYSGDTRPTATLVELARGCDVLVHEATLDRSLEGKAESFGHSSARQAAEQARKAGTRALFLTHISPRYEEPDLLEAEAREVFPKARVAEDLMEYDVPYRD